MVLSWFLDSLLVQGNQRALKSGLGQSTQPESKAEQPEVAMPQTPQIAEESKEPLWLWVVSSMASLGHPGLG